MKEYLTIGELAAIFKMDVQLLRHYDAKGLLVPSHRDPENNRRLYHFDQVYPLATIRYLRKLGYPLKQIDAFMRAKDVNNTMQTLTTQAELLRRQCEELIETVNIIQKKLEFIDRESWVSTNGSFHRRTYPPRPFIHIGDEINLFTHELFYFYPTLGFYQGPRKWFGAYLYDEDSAEVPMYLAATEFIPGGDYLCGYHRGPYQTIQNSIDALLEQAGAYAAEDCVVTLNIIDQFVESHPANYITGLEVRLRADCPAEIAPLPRP